MPDGHSPSLGPGTFSGMVQIQIAFQCLMGIHPLWALERSPESSKREFQCLMGIHPLWARHDQADNS